MTEHKCAACVARVKNWEGSDPRCAFTGPGATFTPDNWACATLGHLRELAEDIGRPGVSTTRYCEHSQSVCQFDVYEVEWPEDGTDMAPGFVLWMTWYKSRGKTEGLWLMGDVDAPKRPTEGQCLAVLRHYGCSP